MAYNYITNIDSPNYTPASQAPAVYGMSRMIEGITIHWWGDPANNPSFDGVVSWLSRPNGNSSAHYVATGTGRKVACIVPPQDIAWHSGSAFGNARTIGVEMDPRCRPEDYDIAAELTADIRSAYGDHVLYGHRDWMATQCPGNYDIYKIDAMSYAKFSASEWGKGGDKAPSTPPPPPIPTPIPVPESVNPPEWIKNLKDIADIKLTVLPAAGTPVVNLNSLQIIADSTIPRGTQIDIAKETTVNGQKYYISQFSSSRNIANGIPAGSMGIPEKPPVQEKPEWLKNLKDITDVDMYTRSEAPVLNLEDGATAYRLPINSKVRITHSTVIVGNNLLVIEGEKTVIETIYLSDTPISNPDDDIKQRVSALEVLVRKIAEFLSSMFKGFK